MKFLKSLSRKFGLGKNLKAKSKVDGFSFSVEKKEGVLLKAQSKDAPAKDLSINEFYEVTVGVDGSNPEYPFQEKPWTHRFTIASGASGRNTGFGVVGDTYYIPNGSRWTGFELVEEFCDASSSPWIPPHHTVMLRGHFKDSDGRKSSVAVGGWVRKSEKETDAWKDASKSSLTYY